LDIDRAGALLPPVGFELDIFTSLRDVEEPKLSPERKCAGGD
jgi:hypothetical protein